MNKTLSLFIFNINKCKDFKEGEKINPTERNMEGKLAFVGEKKLEPIYKYTTRVQLLAPTIDMDKIYDENTQTDVDNHKEVSWLEREFGDEYKEKKNIRIKREDLETGGIVFSIDGRELRVSKKELLTSYMVSKYAETIVADFEEAYHDIFDISSFSHDDIEDVSKSIGSIICDKNEAFDVFSKLASHEYAKKIISDKWKENSVLIMRVNW